MVSDSAPSGISALLRGVRAARPAPPPRPEGRLVWMHLPAGLPASALAALRDALDETNVLITLDSPAPKEELAQRLPGPRRAMIDEFLTHWKPDLLLWGTSANGLPYTRRAKRAGIPVLFANLLGQSLPAGFKGRQFTEFFHSFQKIMLEDPEEKARLLKHELDESRVVHCKPLSEVATAVPENEAVHRRISGALGPRPIWCAALVSRGEIGALLAAHRHAVKAIPNLLLVVVPRATADVIGRQIADDGWRLGELCENSAPDKQAEVLLAPDTENLSTWLRLAAVTYMGGTLYGPEAADPFAPLAVGSAVLSGPNRHPFEQRYARLAQAGALAEAETNAVLPARLVATLAPDQSARLALKAWDIGSEGAEAIAVLVREINATLEAGDLS